MKKDNRPQFWGDFWWSKDDKKMAYGVEAMDEKLTMDGCFVCLTEIPKSPKSDSYSDGAIDRANTIISALEMNAARERTARELYEAARKVFHETVLPDGVQAPPTLGGLEKLAAALAAAREAWGWKD